jgi:hypothetical protein
MNKFLRSITIAALLAQPVFAWAQNEIDITTHEIKQHITFLASDSLKGRKPGTPEGRTAAEYIARSFSECGLKLMGEKGFQYFEVVTAVQADEKNRLAFDNFQGELGKDFVPVAFSENAGVTANVVFAGYGFDFENDSLRWHDYEGVDVKGKWALVLREDPEANNPQSLFLQHAPLRKKALVARDKGAAGLLIVSGVALDEKDQLMPLHYDQIESGAGLPIIHIQRAVADKLLAESGKNIAAIEQELIKQKKPASFELNVAVSAVASVVQTKATTQNVIAFLPGADARLKNEFIIVGAHYDHLGFGGPGSGSRQPDTLAIHNGADDNASGVAALLEIAEKLAANRKRLQRSLLFVSFGAEEMGLLGSKFFTQNPLIDLKQVKMMFNLDMVGHLNPETKAITLGGTGTAAGLDGIVQHHNGPYGFDLKLSPEGYGPSDHASFYAENIPVLFFFTGVHEQYHTPEDDTEGINFAGEKSIADYAYDLIVTLANQEPALVYQEAGPKSRPSAGRGFKVTLGVVPDFSSAEKTGFRIDGVRKGGPADRAGMQKGDIIVAIEGKAVTNIYDYMYRLNELKPGQRASVEFIRDGKKTILIVEL